MVKTIITAILLLGLVGCMDDFDRTVTLGPGTFIQASRGELIYAEDQGDVFSSETVNYFSQFLETKHCDSAKIKMSGSFAETIEAKGCK